MVGTGAASQSGNAFSPRSSLGLCQTRRVASDYFANENKMEVTSLSYVKQPSVCCAASSGIASQDHKIIKGTERLVYEEKLNRLRLFRLEKR